MPRQRRSGVGLLVLALIAVVIAVLIAATGWGQGGLVGPGYDFTPQGFSPRRTAAAALLSGVGYSPLPGARSLAGTGHGHSAVPLNTSCDPWASGSFDRGLMDCRYGPHWTQGVPGQHSNVFADELHQRCLDRTGRWSTPAELSLRDCRPHPRDEADAYYTQDARVRPVVVRPTPTLRPSPTAAPTASPSPVVTPTPPPHNCPAGCSDLGAFGGIRTCACDTPCPECPVPTPVPPCPSCARFTPLEAPADIRETMKWAGTWQTPNTRRLERLKAVAAHFARLLDELYRPCDNCSTGRLSQTIERWTCDAGDPLCEWDKQQVRERYGVSREALP